MTLRAYLRRLASVLLFALSFNSWLAAVRLPKQVPGLHYPRSAQLARIQGTVILDVTLDPDGNVTEVKLVSGNLILAAAARENARLWKFEGQNEKRKNGRRLIFVFRLAGECTSQCCPDSFVFHYPSRVEITAPLLQIQGDTLSLPK
jgi:TonB family protein